MTLLLDIRALEAGYRERIVLRDLSIPSVQAGQTVALVGPNAAGKSTLLRAIAGLISARGEVRLGENNLLALGPAARSQLAAFMPQSLPAGRGLTVIETVLSALRAVPASGDADKTRNDEERAASALAKVGLLEQALRPLDRLSGGQRQLAGIAQAIVRQPLLMLFDEPTSALDLRHQLEVMNIVRGLAREGRIVVAVMHDLALAARYADRVLLLHEGRVIADGTPEEAINARTLAGTYGVDARVERCSQGFLQIIADRPITNPAQSPL